MVLGAILGFSGNLMYCISYDFMGFLVAEIIMGVGLVLFPVRIPPCCMIP